MASTAINMAGPGGVSFPTAPARPSGKDKPKPNAKDFSDIGVSEDDRRTLLDILRQYRNSWSPNRIENFRIWSRNSLFRKGVQILGWDPGGNCWFDALAEYRKSGDHDGEDTGLEPFISNMTLACGMIYTTTLTGATPQTVVTPADWRNPQDVATAKKAAAAVRIVQKKNKIAQLVQEQFESQFDFGCYFRHVRAVTAGDLAGWDKVASYADFEVKPGPRMKCPRCGTERPLQGAGNNLNGLMQCPRCGAGLGPECYYGEGEGGYTSLKMAGMNEVPRAGVRISIETPMRVDGAPWAKTVGESPILVWEREIDIGEARMLNPDVADALTGGMPSATSPQAELEKLRRLEIYSVEGAQTVDTGQSTVTDSEAWMQPCSFYRTGDRDFGDRMREAFPKGLRIVNMGETTTDIEPAEVTKEWTHCPVMKGYGLYPPSPAERVVPFNMALNRANETVDDFARRGSTGLNLAAAGFIDVDKMNKRPLPPGRLVTVPTSVNGKDRPIGEIIAHYDTPIAAQMWDYPMRIISQMMLVALLPPQLSGGGTQEDVPTMGGQQQMLERAMAVFRGLWGMAKAEQAEADGNVLYWLQKLVKVGAIQEMWEVKKGKGGAFQPNAVAGSELTGDVEFEPDEDQGLPATPEQLRAVMQMIFEQIGQGNMAAAQIADEPENAEMMISSLAPGMVAPTEAQREKTLGDLASLCDQPGDPTGEAALASEPDVSDDLTIAIEVCERYLQQNARSMKKALDGAWQRCQRYLEQARDLDAAKKTAQAKRQTAIQAASAPPQPGPDQGTQAELKEMIAAAQQAIPLLLKIGAMDPALTKATATAQVSALKEIVDTTVDAAKLAAGGK
jgi:hypothetical protein